MKHWLELGLAVLTDCVEVVTFFFCQVRGHIALGGAWVDCDHLCSHSGRQVVNFSSASSSLMPLLVFWSQLSKITDQHISFLRFIRNILTHPATIILALYQRMLLSAVLPYFQYRNKKTSLLHTLNISRYERLLLVFHFGTENQKEK